MFARLFAFAALLLAFVAPAEALAEVKVASVNMQRAINEVTEGKNANARLEKMYADKKAQLDKMRADLERKNTEYEQQKLLLSDTARRQKEEELQMAMMQYQQLTSTAEQQFQVEYQNAMAGLIGKMKTIVGKIATERGYTLVVEVSEASSVVWAASNIDITTEVITRYNAANPGK